MSQSQPKHIEVSYTPVLREKGGGVLEGLPLCTTFQKAKELGVEYRAYRPEKGESWQDVMARCKGFLNEVVTAYVFNKGKKEEVTKTGPEEDVKELAKDFKKKAMVSGKKTGILSKDGKEYPKVLAVTHGGFIMEFINMYRELKGMGISEKNAAKNTAIYSFRIECAQCKGVCKGCKAQKIAIKMITENDNSHTLKK